MSDSMGPLGDAANAAAANQQETTAHDIGRLLIGRGATNQATGGSGRIEASLNLEPYSRHIYDLSYLESTVAQLIERTAYPPKEYSITVKCFDTRALLGGSDYDNGVFRIFFWATPVTK